MDRLTEIFEKALPDLLTTALEGGSNYWYYIPYKSVKTVKKYKKQGQPFLDGIIAALNDNQGIAIHDLETTEALGLLTKDAGLRAFRKMATDYPDQYVAIITETYDAADADLWLQLTVMGEIVFA